MEQIVSLAKRRGFIFPSSEIYGGIGGFWDWGPIGAELKNNIKRAWWKEIVYKHNNIVGLDSSIIMNPKVWEASGHTTQFADPMVDCKKCKKRFRADHLIESLRKEEEGVTTSADIFKLKKALKKVKCPECKGELTEPKRFNLMFKTYTGPVEDTSSLTYLRPETCQGIFVNFDTIRQTMRLKIPFGIAQIGKAFRNEVTPSDFVFRSREFEQVELEFFVNPKEDEKWFKFWQKERLNWFLNLGIKKENLRLRDHKKDELAHYAKSAVDIEYRFPFGWRELEGVANRTDYDLKKHSEVSGKDLSYFNEGTSQKYIPYVIEPSLGIERAALVFILDAYDEDEAKTAEGKKEKRVVLRFHKDIAPYQVAVLPLSNHKDLVPVAKKVWEDIRDVFRTRYDETQSIGKRYRRQDEIGTPYCVTVDFETLKDKAVTIRDRDTMKQKRVKIVDLKVVLSNKFEK
ncbi:MAG: glycine--tRNA ligase [Candidatus Aenigmarchaeota archaeon]|nr:glycine--tRNA ligase [Candidatus Aenigmarchaeota archaeon]